jgi:hypothetical protein
MNSGWAALGDGGQFQHLRTVADISRRKVRLQGQSQVLVSLRNFSVACVCSLSVSDSTSRAEARHVEDWDVPCFMVAREAQSEDASGS